MRYTRNRILILSFLLEGVLALVFFIWAKYRGFEFSPMPQAWELGYGIAFAIPLFILNLILFGSEDSRFAFLRSCFEFKDQVVRPLAQTLDVGSSIAVALCAGIGEELFFRGVVQTEYGLFAASVSFSLLHFGTATRKYLMIATLYAAIGMYFGLLAQYFSSLWVPVIAHACYDLIALIYLRYFETPSVRNMTSFIRSDA